MVEKDETLDPLRKTYDPDLFDLDISSWTLDEDIDIANTERDTTLEVRRDESDKSRAIVVERIDDPISSEVIRSIGVLPGDKVDDASAALERMNRKDRMRWVPWGKARAIELEQRSVLAGSPETCFAVALAEAGLGPTAIADELEKSVSTVSSQLSRAREQLQRARWSVGPNRGIQLDHV